MLQADPNKCVLLLTAWRSDQLITDKAEKHSLKFTKMLESRLEIIL